MRYTQCIMYYKLLIIYNTLQLHLVSNSEGDFVEKRCGGKGGRVKMSTQLGVAWTTVIQILAHGFPNNIPLQKTCNLLLYKLDDYSDEEISKFEEIISKIAKAKKAGVDDETLELLASFLPDIKDK